MTKEMLMQEVDKISDIAVEVSKKLWDNPEISGNEKESANLFRKILKENEFRIVEVEKMPNAFYGEFGSGSPVIGLLAEYDALPSMSQKASTRREPVKEGAPGHGCGHNLLGTANLVAALAIKKLLEEEKISGTVRLYGCPEEEKLCGKGKMIFHHAFEGCELALCWHPDYRNGAMYECGMTALNSIRFNFQGTASHAGGAPHLGRSALDAVELMNVGTNYLREHIVDGARIHYSVKCDYMPNIVPANASSWYYVRGKNRKDVDDITRRLIKIAQGAALMTETEITYDIDGGCYNINPNYVLADVTDVNMRWVEMPQYTKEEIKFAMELMKEDTPNLQNYVAEKQDFKEYVQSGKGSTDCGDVSFIMPMAMFLAATWPTGSSCHTWTSASCAGMGIGQKGMLYAAKVFAGIFYDLIHDDNLVKAAKEEFQTRTGGEKYIYPGADYEKAKS